MSENILNVQISDRRKDRNKHLSTNIYKLMGTLVFKTLNGTVSVIFPFNTERNVKTEDTAGKVCVYVLKYAEQK